MSQPQRPVAMISLLAMLTWLNVLNFADRTLLGNLAKQISDDPDLNISYETIGFLTGYGFIIFYTFIGIGMGALADRWHRMRLIASGLALWSALTAATGYARTLTQIAVCRAFIGVGEATLTPASLSILGETFPPRLRAFASGAYYAGIPLGAGIGMIVSGYLLPNYGWRGCFVILGGLGMVFVLPLLFLPDRARQFVALSPERMIGQDARVSKAGALRPLLWTLRRSPALVCTILAASLAVYAQASGQFILTWLQRERGMTYGGAAIMGGWLYLIGGTLGSFCGGLLSDWFHRVLPSGGRLWFLVCVNIVFAPVGALFYLSDVNSLRFQLLWAATSFGFMVWYGAAYSTVQELAPPRSRATAIALMIFSVNFLGAGPGPWVTGWLGANLERILSEQGVLARLITPVLDWFHIEPTQGFTFALLLSVGVAFLGLPLNMIAAIRYRRDLELVTDVFPAGHANMGGTTPTTGA